MAARNIVGAVRELCCAFPGAEEFVSHGSPNYRAGGKTFATFAVNHHGDGRIALWLACDAATQNELVRRDPKHFFVPPYVGVRGWLGLRLDQGFAWRRTIERVQAAYVRVAPPKLRASLTKTPSVAAPSRKPKLADLDPLLAPRARKLQTQLGKLCLALPGTSAATQFGFPVWQVGKRTFAQFYHREGKLTASFWVGIDSQPMMTLDPRYHVPAYSGHNGWIGLDLSAAPSMNELSSLVTNSYRHFAPRQR